MTRQRPPSDRFFAILAGAALGILLVLIFTGGA